MQRFRGEADSVELTNPGPNPTVDGAIGIVAGYATVCSRGGVVMGKRASYMVTGRYRANVKAVAAIAEGDYLKVDADGVTLVKAADINDSVVGKVNQVVAANTTALVWFRLHSKA